MRTTRCGATARQQQKVQCRGALAHHLKLHFFAYRLATYAPQKTKKSTTHQVVLLRSEADSNRCSSFCRAVPSHSAIRPAFRSANIQTFFFSAKFTPFFHQKVIFHPFIPDFEHLSPHYNMDYSYKVGATSLFLFGEYEIARAGGSFGGRFFVFSKKGVTLH